MMIRKPNYWHWTPIVIPLCTTWLNLPGIVWLHGNVWEWCQDWLSDYDGRIALDPQGLVSGSSRVCRGDDWDDGAGDWSCRSASRGAGSPGTEDSHVGFRVVLA